MIRNRLFLLLTSALAVCAQGPLRLIDVHTHLLEPNVSRDEQIARFKQAGAAATVIMSNDPAVLRDLTKRYSDYVIPFASIARDPGAEGVKIGPNTAEQLKKLLDEGAVCGLGELGTNGSLAVAGLGPNDPAANASQGVRIAAILLSQNYRNIYGLAAERKVPLNMHVQLEIPEILVAFSRVAEMYPAMPLILAHAGWNAGSEIINKLLREHPNVSVDLSIRLDPLISWRNPRGPSRENERSILAADSTLQPEWRNLIERYPSRFLFAMDISNTGGGRVSHTRELVEMAPTAFRTLPRDTQEAITHGNFEKLVAGCPSWPRR